MVADRLEHPVPSELAHRIDGSGRVALRLAAVPSVASDRFRSLGVSGAVQEHLVSASPTVGTQDLAEPDCESPRPPSSEPLTKARFT